MAPHSSAGHGNCAFAWCAVLIDQLRATDNRRLTGSIVVLPLVFLIRVKR